MFKKKKHSTYVRYFSDTVSVHVSMDAFSGENGWAAIEHDWPVSSNPTSSNATQFIFNRVISIECTLYGSLNALIDKLHRLIKQLVIRVIWMWRRNIDLYYWTMQFFVLHAYLTLFSYIRWQNHLSFTLILSVILAHNARESSETFLWEHFFYYLTDSRSLPRVPLNSSAMQFRVHSRGALRNESLKMLSRGGSTNEFRYGYTSPSRAHGCISRSYRRLEISLPGRCSRKPPLLPSSCSSIRLLWLSCSWGRRRRNAGVRC